MAHDHDTAGHDSHDDHSHGGTAQYIYVFIALCVLTTISFMTYFSWWHAMFGTAASRTMMMAVSCMKALLVMGFFMHLIWEANWKYVLTIPAGMMSIFLILMLVPDVGCRYNHYTEERLLHSADPNTAEHVHHDEHADGSHDGAADHKGHGHEMHDGHGDDETNMPPVPHGDEETPASDNDAAEDS